MPASERSLKRAAQAVVAASAALAAAALVRTARAATTEAERKLEDAERERLRLLGELKRRESELVRRRDLIERLHRGRRAERDWNQELRSQLQRAHTQRRDDEDEPSDPHELILRAAIELVEAQKGLLLSRDDADADGRLDFVCAHGFDHDPARGSVAQRFAREVLERDRIVREDARRTEPIPPTPRSGTSWRSRSTCTPASRA